MVPRSPKVYVWLHRYLMFILGLCKMLFIPDLHIINTLTLLHSIPLRFFFFSFFKNFLSLIQTQTLKFVTSSNSDSTNCLNGPLRCSEAPLWYRRNLLREISPENSGLVASMPVPVSSGVCPTPSLGGSNYPFYKNSGSPVFLFLLHFFVLVEGTGWGRIKGDRYIFQTIPSLP